MKLIVFGATGSIGRHVVEQALEQGYQVTAFSRNPVDENQTNMKIFQGDVLDPIAVKKAVKGHDSVICALGAGAKGTVRSEGAKNIVRAMESAHVQRLVCLSTLGVGESRANLNFLWKYIMFRFLLRKAYEDHVKQEQYIRESSVNYTIVRPAAFTDGKRTGIYQHGNFTNEHNIKLKISRPDVADFMLKLLNESLYMHKAPGLSY